MRMKLMLVAAMLAMASLAHAQGGTIGGGGGGGTCCTAATITPTDSIRFTGTTSVIIGGAGNMTIRSGTGNSRSITLQTTSSTGVAQDVFKATNSTIRAVLLSGLVIMDSGVVRGKNLANGGLTLTAVDNNSNPQTFASGAGDTLKLPGHLIATGLTSEPSTQSALCINAGGGQVYINAAATCTVSARRFKVGIATLNDSLASRIVAALRPVTYREKNGTPHFGLVAEEADSVDHRLATRNASGQVQSVNYEQVTTLLLSVVQQQQRDIDALYKIIVALGGAAGAAGVAATRRKRPAA